jgi:hypothetical protein
MRLEVCERATNKSVETYQVEELTLFDFTEWRGVSSLEIPLENFSSRVRTLDAVDPITQLASSIATTVSFYLPKPIEKEVMRQFKEQQVDLDKALQPDLDLISIISAIADFICANHLPNEVYKVRISE